MDPTKFYCRSSSQSTTGTGTSLTTTSPATNICTGNNEYSNCGNSHLSSGYDCKEHYSKNVNSKNMINSRSSHSPATAVTGASDAINSNLNSNESYNNNAGNYINVMQVPVGSLQYQRRKLAPHEFQSRLYYNTADYRCRDEYHTNGDGSNYASSSPSPSVQLQHPHQHQHQTHHHQQTSQHHPQHAQTSGQQQQHHHHSSSHHHSQAQPQYNQIQQQQTPRQSVCSPNGQTNVLDESQSCSRYVAQSGRIVAATQTQTSGTNNSCHTEQLNDGTLANISMPAPPMMYAVHRVVTTAQIQTAVGNTFASSSSVSSVVSALRNESECTGTVAGTSAGLNSKCLSGNNAGSTAGYLSDTCNAMSNNGSIVRGSSGLCTSATYLTQQQQQKHQSSSTSDSQNSSVARTGNNSYSTTNTLSNTNINNSTKSSTALPRALQNVIPTCVYLMSRVAVHMEIEGTAQCPTQVMLAAALGCEELGIANKLLAQSIFGLWMTSTLLEIQLKPHHRPYAIRVAWQSLLEKFSDGNPIEKKFDEPMIMLKRNVFFSKRDEEKIKDHRILELLYEEAKHNVLSGKYIMEPVHSLMLGGIQARIELGPYNSHTHTVGFFRENQSRFLPQHVAKSSNWSWLPVSRKNSAEVKLLEQFKRVPQTATTRKLMRKYLEFCWALPFYGAAFFHGQVEQPVRGLISLVSHKDVEVHIAINERGVFVIDPAERTLLLGLRYEDLSWDFAKPSSCEDAECQTCIFIQFDAIENGIQLSKLMQIFSKQAALIDALISHFAEQMRKRKQDSNISEQFHDEPNPIQNNGNGVLCNKLSRLTLATFDEEGRCIGQMGSLSISY